MLKSELLNYLLHEIEVNGDGPIYHEMSCPNDGFKPITDYHLLPANCTWPLPVNTMILS